MSLITRRCHPSALDSTLEPKSDPKVPFLRDAWEAFDNLTESFPDPPVPETASLHSRYVRQHWKRSLRAPEEKLYSQREKAAFEEGHLNLLKVTLAGPLSAHVCDMGNIVVCQARPAATPFPNGMPCDRPACWRYEVECDELRAWLAGSKVFVPEIGLSGPHTDWRIAFGRGWELLNGPPCLIPSPYAIWRSMTRSNHGRRVTRFGMAFVCPGKFQMSTKSTSLESLLTYTDTEGTEAADRILQRPSPRPASMSQVLGR